MTTNTSPILGEAVFGTMDGLFASGSGCLAGIKNSANVFEFRQLDATHSLVPERGDHFLFRSAIRSSSGEAFDLIGVVAGALDLASRRGYIGCCAAVDYGDCENYQVAFEVVANKFSRTTEHYLRDGKFQRIGRHHEAPQDEDRVHQKLTYSRLDRVAKPVFLSKDWLETENRQIVFDAMSTVVLWGGDRAPSIFVLRSAARGVQEITPELIDELQDELRTQKEHESRLEAKRQAELAQQERAYLAQLKLVPRQLRILEERVTAIERELGYQVAPECGSGFETSRPKSKRVNFLINGEFFDRNFNIILFVFSGIMISLIIAMIYFAFLGR